jgi:hypothetical protein
VADQSEAQRQIEQKRAEDKAAMDRRAAEIAAERARESAEEWRS